MTQPKYTDIERATRKYKMAWTPFEGIFSHLQMYTEYKPQKDSVELTAYFRYQGVKYRHDYEIFLLEHPPKVQDIRENIWWTLRDYQKSKGVSNTVNATRYASIHTNYGTLVSATP